ncbi:MAG: SDR family oxidoreductase [Microbacteriaceae bacterium]
MSDLWDLSGRRALVTGASAGGLGQHFALSLARAGADVAVLDRPQEAERLAETSAAVRAIGVRSESVHADVTVEEELESAIDLAEHGLGGGVDIVVSAAGVMLREAAVESTPGAWRRVVDVNLTGTWLTTRVVARRLIASGAGWGRFVTVSTQYAGIAGPLPESSYYASKAGVANLTRSLASEWAPHGITVNCLAPGAFFPTRMTAPLADDPGRLESITRRTMLGRLGDAERDLDGPLVFLASDAAAYVTGAVLHVDGGWSAW